MKKLFILTILFTSSISFSQTTCDSLLLLKKKVYGFKPSELTDTLKSLKNKDLDLFWKTARNNPKEATPCLKTLIENETGDSYFCFDASSLLVRLDSTNTYLPTVIKGLNKCELKDLQLSSFLEICYYLSYKKQDITELATKLISVPDAKIFLSRHFITLDAIDASIFLFNDMPTETAEKTLIAAISNGNATAKHNAAVVLNLLSTDTGDQFLNSLIEKKELDDATIQYIMKDRKRFIIKPKGSKSRSKILEYLNDVPYNFEKEFFGFAGNGKLIGSACKQLTKQDIEKIRIARKKSTPGLSDEALHEYFALTAILMTVRDKKEN
ncbi:MAG: hypothetical protein V4572_07835 [Bacteroidota bacterium]